MSIEAVHVQVGDYVLSPEMCVERKSLSDLRQSFLSGRLFHQAEAMSKHYKTPILLIEFERDKAFALHATSEIGSDINVCSCPHSWQCPVLQSFCIILSPIRMASAISELEHLQHLSTSCKVVLIHV
jgi:ERCC4-type nuclease